MNHKIMASLFFFVLVFSVSARVFDTDIVFIKEPDSAQINSIRVVEGTPDNSNPMGKYVVRVRDTTNAVLSETKYAIGFFLLASITGDENFLQELNEQQKNIYLPYEKTAAFITVEHNSQEILRFALEGVTCNSNGSCDSFETALSCPQDCDPAQPDGYCNSNIDGICDPDCKINIDFDCRAQQFDSCGNNICEPKESIETCRKDCTGYADNLCDRAVDGRCDPDCSPQQDVDCREFICNANGLCEPTETPENCPSDCAPATEQQSLPPPNRSIAPNLWLVSGLLLLIVGIIVMAWFVVSKRKM